MQLTAVKCQWKVLCVLPLTSQSKPTSVGATPTSATLSKLAKAPSCSNYTLLILLPWEVLLGDEASCQVSPPYGQSSESLVLCWEGLFWYLHLVRYQDEANLDHLADESVWSHPHPTPLPSFEHSSTPHQNPSFPWSGKRTRFEETKLSWNSSGRPSR